MFSREMDCGHAHAENEHLLWLFDRFRDNLILVNA